MLRMVCPGCKTTLTVGDELAGKSVRCPKCRAVVSAPAAAVPPVAQPKSAPTPVARPKPAAPPPAPAARSKGPGGDFDFVDVVSAGPPPRRRPTDEPPRDR